MTPDSLLALHEAGYAAVMARLGPGRLLDVGCGEGSQTAGLAASERPVVGVDYAVDALVQASGHLSSRGVHLVAGDGAVLAFATGSFDWVCSSHVVEHFAEPGGHVAELARVLRPGGTCFVVTPNATADFENPFHRHLFGPEDLGDALGSHFTDVWVGGLEGSDEVKADFAGRRAKAARLLRLDVLDLRHRVPRSWYVGAYTTLLPLAYRLLDRHDRNDGNGGRRFGPEDFFVADHVDDTTPVLFAVARRPRRGTSTPTHCGHEAG